MAFSLKLLGGASIEGPDGPVTGRAAQRHRLALLALLAASPRGMTRDKLTALLWPEKPERRARHALSDSIYRINSALPEDAVTGAGEELRLEAEALPSDLAAFRRALEEEEWERATGLYTGPFLDGFHLPGAAEFERRVDGERRRLARLYGEALESLAGERAARGDRTGAAEAWRRRAALDPYDSRVAVRLMEALEAAGNPAGALRHARAHTALLEEELGTGPDPDVVAVADRIRQREGGEVEVAVRAPGAGPEESPAAPEPPSPPAPAVPGFPAGGGAPSSGDRSAEPSSRPDSPASRPSARARRIGLGVAGVLGVVLAGAWIVGRLPTAGSGVEGGVAASGGGSPTIAVLPLEPLGDGPDVGTLADGIHSDLITALSRLGRFRVIQRASTLPYRAGDRPLGEVASELGADLIVEGDVRRVGDRVRVNARLTRAGTGRVLWADNMDRRFTLPDVFDLQTSIVERIAGALERSLTPAERERISAPPTDEPSAWQFYHQARSAFDGTRSGNVEQERLLRRALEIDPSFAAAWASLAIAYAWRPLWTGSSLGAWDSAVAFARRSLDEDPGTGKAYAALSDVYGNQGFSERAIRTARIAVDLNPNDAFALHRLGRPLHERGDFVEGLRYLRAAAGLSPNRSHYWAWAGHARIDLGDRRGARRLYRHTLALEPDDWQGLEGLAWAHFLAGRADSALAASDRLAAAHPAQPGPLASAGMIALYARDHARAERRLRRVVELSPDAPVHARSTSLVRTMLGFLRLRAGDAAAADTLFGRSVAFVNEMISMGARAPRWPYELGQIRAARGRTDDALDWLERAYDRGFRWAWMLERNPLLDPLRDEPGFRGIVARIDADVEAMRLRAEALGGVEP